jgi:HD-GYP domain-containing protein (c-di-GMP phosphodiesterase class II)
MEVKISVIPSNEYEDFIGKRLLSPIYDNNNLLLIAKGTVLLKRHIEKLAKFKVQIGELKVIEDKDSVEQLTPIAEQRDSQAHPPHNSEESQDQVKRTQMVLHEIDLLIHKNGIIPLAEVEKNVLPFINETAKKYNLFKLFSKLKNSGEYRYKQSIGVAVLATSLGKRLGLNVAELGLLTTAASLYDIGTVKLPSNLMSKTSRFDEHEYQIMKEHTVLGYELLKHSGVDSRIALVALQHHEREDGSGYPSGLKGNQIDRLSKIVALADVYMALISDRPYRSALPFFDVIQEIHQGIILHRFDSIIGLTFLDSLLSTQVGCDVVLTDERRGRILLTNVNYPTRPLIDLDSGEFLDLSKMDNIHIKEVIG